MDGNKTTTYRRPATEEAREKRNAYHREYRRQNPDKVIQWRINQAKRLLEAATADAIHDGQGGSQGDREGGAAE